MENLEEIKKEAAVHSEVITTEANVLVIQDQQGLEYAALLNKQAKDEMKVITDAFKPHKDNAFKAHKDLVAAENAQLAPFKSITNILKPKILRYQAEQEEIARKEREAKIAKQRLAESQAKEAAEKEKAVQVNALLEAGDLEKAEAVSEAPTPEPVVAFVPEAKPVKVAGAGTRKVWKARVLDPRAVPDMFKIVDQKALDAYAKSTQGNQKMDGVEFYQETQLTGK
jgi:hypothetical protein